MLTEEEKQTARQFGVNIALAKKRRGLNDPQVLKLLLVKFQEFRQDVIANFEKDFRGFCKEKDLTCADLNGEILELAMLAEREELEK